MQVTKIKVGSSFNKLLKDEIKRQFPEHTGLIKRKVPCIGNVFYIKNNHTTIGKIFRENDQLVIYKET